MVYSFIKRDADTSDCILSFLIGYSLISIAQGFHRSRFKPAPVHQIRLPYHGYDFNLTHNPFFAILIFNRNKFISISAI